MLARQAGMTITELLEEDVVWVARLKEFYHQVGYLGVALL